MYYFLKIFCHYTYNACLAITVTSGYYIHICNCVIRRNHGRLELFNM